MKYIYICGAVSEEACDRAKMSVAGNKFSINMAKALDRCCGGELFVISTTWIPGPAGAELGGEIWPGKKRLVAKRGKRFVLSELKLRKNIMRLLKQIHRESPDEELVLFLENAPFAAATACVALKKKLKMSCYSITIDSPFAGQFGAAGLKGRINKWMFDKGLASLQRFEGLISFTEDVKKDLGVDIPFCAFSIGCNRENIPEQLPEITPEKTAVYAGTLMYYNGIQELLKAFVLLGPAYQLHIYGYGPLENEVEKAAAEHSNIIFHGRFDPKDTASVLSKYQLLLNTRRLDRNIENFTFPSKLVDYVLTGKSVLSTRFKTLPTQYQEFVYTIEDALPEAIAEGVRKVFDDPVAIRQERGKAGIAYIKEHQTYEKIAEKILRFAKNR